MLKSVSKHQFDLFQFIEPGDALDALYLDSPIYFFQIQLFSLGYNSEVKIPNSPDIKISHILHE